MKRNRLIVLFGALLLTAGLSACDVDKTGEGEYRVETPTSEEVTTSAEHATEQTATALETAGEAIKEGAREVGQATGTALEKAGQKLQEHSKPGDQK
ncbi:MAG: hypothetical protein ACYC7A_04430 [Thermoanaerobaculia bacterium]